MTEETMLSEQEAKDMTRAHLMERLPEAVASLAMDMGEAVMSLPKMDALAVASFALNMVGHAYGNSVANPNKLPPDLRNLFYYNEMIHHILCHKIAERDDRPIAKELAKLMNSKTTEPTIIADETPGIIL